MELYRNYVVGRLGYPSASAFEEDLAREITLTKMESALQSSVVVSTKAAEAEYRRTNENAKIRYVLVPAQAPGTSLAVTPAEVEAYYKANAAKYVHREQRQVRYLLADYAKLRTQVTPTDADLQAAYQANRQRFARPAAANVLHILVKVDPNAAPAVDAAARAKAQSLVAQLRGGADFGALARANSEDPSSSTNGGAMGWVDMGQTVQPFEQAIFSLPLNTISDPIRSKEFGYHIVKVTDRREQSVRPFEEVRGELTAAATNEKAKEMARLEINRLRTVIRNTKPANAQAFATLANDKASSDTSGWFGRNEAVGGLGNNQPLAEWIFSAKQGDVSDPTGTPRGIAIVYVEGIRPPGTTALDEIRAQVESDVRQEKGREAARASLAQLMAGKKTIDEVATAVGQPAQETTVKRDGGNVAGISGDTLALVNAAMASGVGELKGPIVVGNGAVAMQVVEQKKVTSEELAQNRVSFVDNLRGQQARSLRASLLQRLRKGAEIELNDEITRPTSTPAGV
jgi:peptidyl-prolyl cis-trans isomerase D